MLNSGGRGASATKQDGDKITPGLVGLRWASYRVGIEYMCPVQVLHTISTIIAGNAFYCLIASWSIGEDVYSWGERFQKRFIGGKDSGTIGVEETSSLRNYILAEPPPPDVCVLIRLELPV